MPHTYYWDVFDLTRSDDKPNRQIMSNATTADVALMFGVKSEAIVHKWNDACKNPFIYKDHYYIKKVDYDPNEHMDGKTGYHKWISEARKAREAREKIRAAERKKEAKFKESKVDYLYYHLVRFGNCSISKNPQRYFKQLKEDHGMTVHATLEECKVEYVKDFYVVWLDAYDRDADKGTRHWDGFHKDEVIGYGTPKPMRKVPSANERY